MTALPTRRNRLLAFIDIPMVAILMVGLGIGLFVSVWMLNWLMQPPPGMAGAMAAELTTYAAISVGIGFLLYRVASRYSRWLNLTLILAFIWAVILTLYIVWQMSRLMFASTDDLLYASIFLVFAATIASAFGISASTRVTRGLRQLTMTAQELADGELSARAYVTGHDEVAKLAIAVNTLATQLEQAERQRAEVEALRHDLIAWTSHDLRTPLTSIRAMVEALHDGLVTDEATTRRYYQTIRADIIALNVLIDDLFELAQLDAGGLVLQMSSHSLGDLISDTIESFRALAEQRSIALVGQIDADVDPVTMNSSKIGRVLSNLVSNALRYTPEGGRLHITAVREAAGVKVTVQDTGPGFAPDDLHRVFEKFYRGEQARSRSTGGAGLGLAIAKGIVEAHDGRIWAESPPDGGAIVGFILPA